MLLALALGLPACGELHEPGLREAALEAGALLPDIVEEIPQHLGIQNKQQDEILRFTTTHWNAGDGPLQIRGGAQVAPCDIDGEHYEQCTHSTQELLDASGEVVMTSPAGVALFHPEHNHWHQDDVANFVLRAGGLDGPVVAAGVKVTYCLIDYDRLPTVPMGSRTYFECNAELQGISVGWGDEYHHATHGQDLHVTGLPAGEYTLVFEADPSNKWIELDDGNNVSWLRFDLSRKGANPEITEIEHSACDEVTCGDTTNR